MARIPLQQALAASAFVVLAMPASAGLFDDDEARRAILDLRDKTNGFQATATESIEQNRRATLDLQNQIELLRQELARVRGQNEELQNQVMTLQKSQKDYFSDIDQRLRQIEPQPIVIEGREGMVQPNERQEYDAALKTFRDGNFALAITSFGNFARKYPQSPYDPLVQYWLGSAHYAQRDYKAAIATLQRMQSLYPDHARMPDAMLIMASCQAESGQRQVARKILEQLIAKYEGSDAARVARERLAALR